MYMQCYSALKRRGILTPATTWANTEDIMLSEIRQTRKQILCDSTYTRYLGWANPQKQKVERCLPRAAGRGVDSYCLMGRVSVLQDVKSSRDGRE